jgi:drug/metabolite transporter (DMT)-like permease
MGMAPAPRPEGIPCGAGRRGILWAGATALAIAGYTLCYKASLAHGAQPVALFAVSMLVALPTQLAVRLRRQGAAALARSRQPGLGLTVLAGLLCAASFLLYLKAMAVQGAGVVTTLRNTAIVFAVGFSWALGEQPPARQWGGALLVAAGAVGLAWPG